MTGLYDSIQAAAKQIRQHTKLKPVMGIVLGTGLGALAKEIKNKVIIPYESIPNFPLSTVESHAGQLLIGTLMGKTVVAMQGRFHRYEGYDLNQITFPIRVMRALGAKKLAVFGASGGINREFYPGDLVLISDHINLIGDNPLIGPNDDRLGPRFPDMYNTYDQEFQQMIQMVARENQIDLKKGVYAALTGPCLETAAEYRFLQTIGADCVGMSTVPEVIVARHAGMRVMGITVVTDRCVPDQLGPASVSEIIKAAMQAEPKLTKLFKAVLKRLK